MVEGQGLIVKGGWELEIKGHRHKGLRIMVSGFRAYARLSLKI